MNVRAAIAGVMRRAEIHLRGRCFTKQYSFMRRYNIGSYTYGCPLVLFENSATKLTIGKFCSISADVTIMLGGNHRTDWISTYPFGEFVNPVAAIIGHPSTKGDITIGNDVWIGRGVTILSGVTIGNGAVIAANATVARSIEPYAIAGGNPCRVIKKRFNDETIAEIESVQWWEKEIDWIRNNAGVLSSPDVKKLLSVS